MQNITPTNNAEALRLNQEYKRKKEEAKKYEISSRIYRHFHTLKSLKEQEIAQKEQHNIEQSAHHITPGSSQMQNFKDKSDKTSKVLPWATVASLPWTAKKSFNNLGWLSKDSALYKQDEAIQSTLNSLYANGLMSSGGLINKSINAASFIPKFMPMGAALSSGFIGAKQNRQIRSHRQDKGKIAGAAIAERSGAIGSVIKSVMTAPLALKGLRQLPLIGGVAGAAGDLGSIGAIKITKGLGKALSLGSNFGLGGAGSAGAAGAAGASFITPAVIHTLVGAVALAVPSIIAGMATVKADMSRRKLVAVRQHPSKFIKEYSSAGFVDQIMPRLLSLKQVSPADQVKISLLRLIADSVSPIPKMTEILDYQEQQREKEVKSTKGTISGIGDIKKKTFKDKLGIGFDRIALKAQKFTNAEPFLQLFTYLFEGKTPHDIKQELFNSEQDIDSKQSKETEIKIASKLTGLTVQFLTLLSTSSNKLLMMSAGPESTQILLLSGLYELMRGYVGKWIDDKKETGKTGIKIHKEEDGHKKIDPHWYNDIPGISGIVSAFNLIRKLDTVKLGTNLLGTGVKKIFGRGGNFKDDFKEYGEEKKEKWTPRINKYIKEPLKKWRLGDFKESIDDPKLILKTLGLFKSQEEKINQYQETGLPDDMQTIIYYMKEQLNTLENAFELSKVFLHKLTGESYNKQTIIKAEKKQFDFISGTSVTEDEFNTLTQERKDKVSSHISKETEYQSGYIKKSLKEIAKETAQVTGFTAIAVGSLSTLIPLSLPIIALISAASAAIAAVSNVKNKVVNAPIGNRITWLSKIKNFATRDPRRPLAPGEIESEIGANTIPDDLYKDEKFKPETSGAGLASASPSKIESPINKLLIISQTQTKILQIHTPIFKEIREDLRKLRQDFIMSIQSFSDINESLGALKIELGTINGSLGTINSSIIALNAVESPINTSLGTISEELKKLREVEKDPQSKLLEEIKNSTESSASSLMALKTAKSPDDYNYPNNVISILRSKNIIDPKNDEVENTIQDATGTNMLKDGGPVSTGKKYTVGEVGPELFIPKSRQFAEGGQITDPKKTHLVGERGPEAFIPNTPGKIVPYDELKDILKSKNESYSNASSKDVLNIINQERKDRNDNEFKKIIVDPKTGQLPEIIEILKTISENNEKYEGKKLIDETNSSSTRTATMELTESEQKKKEEKQEKFENDIVEPRKGYLATIIDLLKVNNKPSIIGENKKPEEKDGIFGFISGLFSGGVSAFIPNLLKSIIPLAIPAVIAAIFTTSVLPLIREGMGKLFGSLFGNGENKDPTPGSDAATKGVVTTGVAGLKIGANKGIGALSNLAGGAAGAGAAGLAGAGAAGAGAAGLTGAGAAGLAGAGAAGAAGLAGAGAAGAEVAGSAAGGIGSKILNFGKNLGLKGATKTLGVIAKAAPFIGLGTGIYFAWDRLQKGDIDGAWMELGAGAASMIPIYGTAASLTMTAFLLARDLGKEHEAEALMKLKESLSPEVDKLVGGNIDNYAQLVKDHVIVYDENTKLWVLADPSNSSNAAKPPDVSSLDVGTISPTINPPSPNIPNKENISELRNTKDTESTYDPSKQLKNVASTLTGINVKTIQEKKDEFNKKTNIIKAGQNLSNVTGNAINASTEWVKDTVTGDNALTKTGKWGLETSGKILAGTTNIAADTVAGTQKMLTKDPKAKNIIGGTPLLPTEDNKNNINSSSPPAFATGGYTGKKNKDNKDGFPAIVHPEEAILPLDDPKTKEYLFDALLGPDRRNSNEKYSDSGTLNRIKSLGNKPEDPLNNRNSKLTNNDIYSRSNYKTDMKKFKPTSFSLPSNDPMENYYSNLNESNINTSAIHPAFDPSISDPRRSATGRNFRQSLNFSQERLGSALGRSSVEDLDTISNNQYDNRNPAVKNKQNQQLQSQPQSQHQLQPIIIAPSTNNTTNNQAPRTERYIESSERINKIIDKIFPNVITSFEYAITSFALGQSPFAVSR